MIAMWLMMCVLRLIYFFTRLSPVRLSPLGAVVSESSAIIRFLRIIPPAQQRGNVSPRRPFLILYSRPDVLYYCNLLTM